MSVVLDDPDSPQPVEIDEQTDYDLGILCRWWKLDREEVIAKVVAERAHRWTWSWWVAAIGFVLSIAALTYAFAAAKFGWPTFFPTRPAQPNITIINL